ncbi:MAG: DUF4255 domain-containing protein [Symploca sp. SIO1B1]|nr:DUF4255 domain-containing protein [Symploca sp. SIO1B1]
MFADLDKSLKNILANEMPKDYFSPRNTLLSIYFCMPLDEDIKEKPALNLFLYDVRENLELRSSKWSVERYKNQDGTNPVSVKKPPPTMVDCSYFITSWFAKTSDDFPQQEHQLLGEVMKVLLRFPEIPEQYLHGSLKELDLPVRAACLRPLPTQSLGEFWQAMGGKPKAMLNYTVTIPVPIEDREVEFPLVLESTFHLQQQNSPGG